VKTIRVKASKTYDITVGDGFFDNTGAMIQKSIGGKIAAIVSDNNVFNLYGERLKISLEKAGYHVVVYEFAHGETSKNTEVFVSLVEFLAAENLSRSDVVVALGGGVTGDLAGFAAASYMRGTRFVQIPTTLLAAVDSSVGGKTGLNLSAGKNLLGTFYQPDMVLCDVSLLATLPPEVFADGMAEVIKCAMIDKRGNLYELILKKDPVAKDPVAKDPVDMIENCIEIKRDIVIQDEYEQNVRKLLNFGHTIGHAIEKLSSYKVSHGQAVAIGMVIETRIAIEMGLCDNNCLDRLVEMLEANGLPTGMSVLPDETLYSAKELAAACFSDKKRSGECITMVLPERIGSCNLKEIPINELESIIFMGL